jgi:anti-sigma regulatory factor (Ser/Thr protein kinase)
MSPAQASSPRYRDAPRSVNFGARLPSDRDAAVMARRLVRTRLDGVVETPTLDDVVLVVSELVTNAVRHGRGDIELQIDFDGARVRGNVRDEGKGFAENARTQAAGQVGGNGLHIVEQVASGWGVHQASARVWFELPDSSPARMTRLH